MLFVLGQRSVPPKPLPIRVYDESGNVTATHEQKGDFKEW
jgi:hypothetical protein